MEIRLQDAPHSLSPLSLHYYAIEKGFHDIKIFNSSHIHAVKSLEIPNNENWLE